MRSKDIILCHLATSPPRHLATSTTMSPTNLTGRERMTRTLNFQPVDRAPRQLWYLPGIPMFRQAELDAMLARFPVDIVQPQPNDYYGESERASGDANKLGIFVDEWGSKWRNAYAGVVGQVVEPLIPDWSDLDRLRPPDEILDGANLQPVQQFCAENEQFVNVSTTVRPFERMQFLRGTTNLFMDLGWGKSEVLKLRDMVHEFFLREIEMWCQTDVDGITFMDDWGSQQNLLISPKMWRAYFKPLYADYCRMIHDAGKFVFMHSDGQISSIYPDLIEVGVDALNSQLFCMDIEQLGQQYKGKITFWGEIDRQHILPFGTVDDVRAGVRRVRAALDDGNGGVIAQCEWGLDMSAENVAAVYETWLEP